MTLKFDGWPWKPAGHLFDVVSSFAHHFIAIGEYQLELQYGNAEFGSKETIFLAVWYWNWTDHLEKKWGTSSMLHQALCIISKPSVNWNLSYCPETLNSGQNRRFFVPCELKIWQMTLHRGKPHDGCSCNHRQHGRGRRWAHFNISVCQIYSLLKEIFAVTMVATNGGDGCNRCSWKDDEGCTTVMTNLSR